MERIISLVNSFMPNELLDALEKALGRKICFIPLKVESNKSFPLLSHPDILGTSVGDVFIYSPSIDEEVIQQLKELSVKTIKGSCHLKSEYPLDASYNCLIVKDRFLMHRVDIADESIRKYVNEKQWKMINVKQGYTRCSVLPVTDESFITEDVEISKTLAKEGYSVLLVKKGHVYLHGYKYGFIGGAGATFDGLVTFFGNIEKHPSYKEIKQFIKKSGKEIFSLSENRLEDFGGIFFIEK